MEEVEKLIPLKIITKKKKSGTVTFTVDNNCKIRFYFDTVLGGARGKNSFVISFSMAIYNPLLARIIMEPFNKKDDNSNTEDLVQSFYYLNDLPKEWKVYERYLFSEDNDNYQTAQTLLNDIECQFIPYIIPLTGDYEKLLENYSNPEFVKQLGRCWQFIIGVACAILTHQESKIEEVIVPLAKSDTSPRGFSEFKKSNDYKTELILPIKEYIYNNIFNKDTSSEQTTTQLNKRNTPGR